MTTQIDQANPIAQTGATAVKVVELARGGQPGWSVFNLISPVRDFFAGHILLTLLAAFGIIAVAIWFIVRKHGVTGVAGVLLLARLALCGHLRSIRRIVREAKNQNITLAAAALADG